MVNNEETLVHIYVDKIKIVIVTISYVITKKCRMH